MAEDVEMVLRKTPLFASLTETEMRALAARVSKRHFQRGELLFGEGDPCTGLFLVAGQDSHFQAVGRGPRAGVSRGRTW